MEGVASASHTEGDGQAASGVPEPQGLTGLPAAAEAKKALGNAAFQAKRHREAIEHYTEALEEAGDAAPGVYFSNRAVCHSALGHWPAARADAEAALRRPGGATKKALFQKARAEMRMRLPADMESTLRLAAEHGLREGVEALLREDIPEAACALGTGAQLAGDACDRGGVCNGRGGQTCDPGPGAVCGALGGAAPGGRGHTSADGDGSSPIHANGAPVEQTPSLSSSGRPADDSAASDAAVRAKDLGNAKYKQGAYREALAEYQRSLGLLDPGDVIRKAPLLGNIAAAHLMLRRVGECIAACEQSLALDPSNHKIRQRLATAHIAKGDFAAARVVLDFAGADEVALATAHRLLRDSEEALAAADTAMSKGEPAKALSMLAELETKALFACPALPLSMARCYLELKNYPRVLNATQSVLRENPQSIDALVLRTEALYRNNDTGVETAQWVEPLEQGQRLLKEALSFDPDHSAAQALRKRLRSLCTKHVELKAARDSREFQKATEIIDFMIGQCQDNQMMLAALYSERARCGVRLKDWPRVLKDVGQATYRNHSLVQPYLLRAQALQSLERHDDAVRELEGLFAWHRVQAVYDKLQEAKFLQRKQKRANYYELLGVPSIASQLEIKKAYRERAAEWHPDKKGHLDATQRKNAEEMFKRIGEAYEVLTDSTKKELYDRGYDLEGIEEQIELKKRRTEHGHGHGHCGSGHCGC